jgi:hypothetical protein
MSTREALAAEFARDDVLSFQGRGGQTFDYIEDETVMDRLDEVLGVGTWSIAVEPISVADGIVKVRLFGETPEGEKFSYEDFGYQTRDGGESLKEAVSDGIRRCGRFLGIGRYLYRKHPPISQARGGSSPRASQSPRPVSPPAPVGASNPDEPPFPGEVIGFRQPAAVLPDPRDGYYGDTCPVHQGRPWKETPRGIKCTANNGTRENPDFCTWKPNKRWLAEHELDTAAH